jgi:hypothetical protein
MFWRVGNGKPLQSVLRGLVFYGVLILQELSDSSFFVATLRNDGCAPKRLASNEVVRETAKTITAHIDIARIHVLALRSRNFN